MTLRHHIYSDRLGRYKGVPMTGKVGRPRKPVREKSPSFVGPKLLPKREHQKWLRSQGLIPARHAANTKADRNQQIINYILENGCTFQDAATKFGGISRERVRQIMKKYAGLTAKTTSRIKVVPFRPKTTPIDKFWAKVEKGEHWIWKGCVDNGYGRVYFRGATYAHIVAWMLIKRKKPTGILFNECGNTICVRPDCWIDGEWSDVAKRREAMGRGARKVALNRLPEMDAMIQSGMSDAEVATAFGVVPAYVALRRTKDLGIYREWSGSNRKLSVADAEAIRDALNSGAKIREMAERYDVGETAIWMIKHGKTYKEIL